MTVSQRFWTKVSKGDGCWQWTGATNADGYGRFQFQGRNQHAHRVSWMLANGPILVGNVLHTCDNPPCVRPDHLYLGTQRENMLDASARNRLLRKGEHNGRAKLTWADVAEIRRLWSEGVTQVALGQRFGVSKSAIQFVCKGATWAT